VAGFPPLDFMEGFWTPPGGENPCGLGLTLKVAADSIEHFERSANHSPGQEFMAWFAFPPIRWDVLKSDPLHILLRHSDCEGSIAHSDCEAIASRLEDLIPLLPCGSPGGHIWNWVGVTQKFIDGLRLAAEKQEDVMFY